jgi:hypothetical protein
MEDESEDKLPALNNPRAWTKTLGLLALLILINIVAFLVTFGAGAIVTIPLTIFLAFLLLRDVMPRHRFPRGRPPQGTAR